MNVYDFDGTIYKGDSSVDFYLFTLIRHPSVLILLPKQIKAFFAYKSGKINKTQMKEVFFTFVKKIPDIQLEVGMFWNKNEKNIYKWYRAQKRADDLIISASPEFLLDDICSRLGIRPPIASRVDSKLGKFYSPNCHDREKVVRFRENFGEFPIEEFYSDSRSDSPLAALASKAFFIKKGMPEPWGTVEEYFGD